MERVTLLSADEEISAQSLEALAGSPVLSAASAPLATPETTDDTSDEALQIRAALARAGGNVVRAARLLGIGRNALRYRMRRCGITRAEPGELPILPEPPARRVAAQSAAPEPAVWEQKPVAVLVISFTFPDASDAVRIRAVDGGDAMGTRHCRAHRRVRWRLPGALAVAVHGVVRDPAGVGADAASGGAGGVGDSSSGRAGERAAPRPARRRARR